MRKTGLMLASVSVVLLLILSACGQSNNGAANSSPPSESAPASSEAAAAESSESAPEETPRIASLSIHITNNLLALDITPVGSVVGGVAGDFLPHVKDRLADAKKLGVVADPDLESILSLKPDVIYYDENLSADQAAKFEKIAPSVAFNDEEGTWQDHLRQVAKLNKLEQRAEDFIQAYDDQLVRVKGLIQERIGTDATGMVVRVMAKEMRVHGVTNTSGSLLHEELGVKPAKGIEAITEGRITISQEVLPDFDADMILLLVDDNDDAERVAKQLQDSPIWQGLKAVKNDRVYVAIGAPWLDYSAMGRKISLDIAEELFAK